MSNIIQSVFYLIPGFRIEHFALVSAIVLILVGLFVEKHYVTRLTFFSNSVALISYFGIKDTINIWVGLIALVYFGLAFWSFLAYATKERIKKIKWFEDMINENPWLLKLGSSLVVGGVILYDLLK